MSVDAKIYRTKAVKVSFTPDEYLLLKKICPKARVGEWMREFCLASPDDRAIKKAEKLSANPELVRQIRAVGINTNQIARSLNSFDLIDRIDLLAALRGIENALVNIRDDHSK